ncbi:MAG: PA14 domain-containing protein, partial [Pirellulales bacterium]
QEDWRVTRPVAGTRVDAMLEFLNYEWHDAAGLHLSEPWENFSVQWDGFIRIPYDGTRVYTMSDDGSRMWIDINGDDVFAADGPEFIDNGWGHGHSLDLGPPSEPLAAGTYRLRIQYEETGGLNDLRLLWSDHIAYEGLPLTVPASNLSPTATFETYGLTGSYVDQSLRSLRDQGDWRTTQSIAGSRVDTAVSFRQSQWGDATSLHLTHYSVGVDWNNFSVQWDGVILITDAGTRLLTNSDDGSRLWIDVNGDGIFGTDGTEFIDNGWGGDHALALGPKSMALAPGVYRIRLQYDEGVGGNEMYLMWSDNSQAPSDPTPVPSTNLATTPEFTTHGLVGSYVDRSLRAESSQSDWRTTQTIAGTRLDPTISFGTDSWGNPATVHLTYGLAFNYWGDFSVQWDGFIRIDTDAKQLYMAAAASRMWIDIDNDGTFAAQSSEYFSNAWDEGDWTALSRATPWLAPGVYRIRIQYAEVGLHDVSLLWSGSGDDTTGPYSIPNVYLSTTADFSTHGLIGSYVNQSLRGVANQDDWRITQAIAGTRTDPVVTFNHAHWGNAATVHLTHVSNGDWEDFSVQWDGFVRVLTDGIQIFTKSDDGSRFWIDINQDGVFGTESPEFVDNRWGWDGASRLSPGSPPLVAGVYRIRIQYEEGFDIDDMHLVWNDGEHTSWHNAPQPFDVRGEGQITPLDALLVINELNMPQVIAASNRFRFWRSLTSGLPFFDVNADGLCTPIDALLVINFLNERTNPEAEFAPSTWLPDRPFGTPISDAASPLLEFAIGPQSAALKRNDSPTVLAERPCPATHVSRVRSADPEDDSVLSAMAVDRYHSFQTFRDLCG